ncbi:beta-ketoacyl synthase N-terminal-like domain-containing protein [Vibrio lentus]|nr:beta-ketoacyl synthase N-terminal-like domain-containing protein [Vibrio lentus]
MGELTQDEYQSLETDGQCDGRSQAEPAHQFHRQHHVASRISSCWDFNGPAFTISTAER